MTQHQITNCNSNARTLLKDCVRKLISIHYQLRKSGKPEAIQSNMKHVNLLLTKAAFHTKVILYYCY